MKYRKLHRPTTGTWRVQYRSFWIWWTTTRTYDGEFWYPIDFASEAEADVFIATAQADAGPWYIRA